MPTTEVKWYDGLYGGLVAGTIVALFYALVDGFLTHEAAPGDFFVSIAAVFLHGAAANAGPWALAFGVALHYIASASFGVVYSLLAIRVGTMWHAPASVLWGITWGLLVWLVIHDFIVPLFGIDDIQPAWEGLLGNVFFYGLILSEYMTIVHRRKGAPAP